jgi:hypothetical protein
MHFRRRGNTQLDVNLLALSFAFVLCWFVKDDVDEVLITTHLIESPILQWRDELCSSTLPL